ncbi:MAG: hypothetical protein H0U74_05770 [Bradymonadaceae bacterium]|nr:hypothetical protein [Lujinxingiaceae bacterium]
MFVLLVILTTLVGLASSCSAPIGPPIVADIGHDAHDAESTTGGDVALLKPQIGEPCRNPTDCQDGAACIGTRGHGFICMASCDQPGALCDDSSVCMALAATPTAVCYIGGNTQTNASCNNNLDCIAGTICAGNPADANEAYCLRACHSNHTTCQENEYCHMFNPNRGVCRTKLGAACDGAEDCTPESAFCTSEITDSALPAPMCTVVACESDDDCPPDGRCHDTLCFSMCSSDADCRFYNGYRCIDHACLGG